MDNFCVSCHLDKGGDKLILYNAVKYGMLGEISKMAILKTTKEIKWPKSGLCR